MRRVMILGCAGSSKSTLARRLGERLGLPVVHMDNLFWEPGWVEAKDAVFKARVTTAIEGDAWVTDGNYITRTFPLRLPRADMVIFLHKPRWLLIQRVLWRSLSQWGRTRSDLAEGCPEKVDWPFFIWIWNFDRMTRPRIERAIAEQAPHLTPVHLSGDAEVAAFLGGLP